MSIFPRIPDCNHGILLWVMLSKMILKINHSVLEGIFIGLIQYVTNQLYLTGYDMVPYSIFPKHLCKG